jgi:hypothetical protein
MKTTPAAPQRQMLIAATLGCLCLTALLGTAHAASLTLSWQDNSTDESGFAVERSSDNVTYAQIATTAAGVTSYTDADLPGQTTYHYRVRAFRDSEFSLYSNTAEGLTPDTQPPTVASATAFGSPSLVIVSFNEALDSASASASGNYALSGGITVTSATLDGDTVTLAVTPVMTVGNYTLTVNGVADLSGNAIAPNTTEALAYSTTDPTLICWYPFDILATDASGNGNTGIISGATLTADGKLGPAYVFASVGDYIQMPLAGLSPGSGTFAAWVKPAAFSTGAHSILGHSSSATAWADRLQLYIDDSGGNLDLGMGDNHSVHVDIVPLVVQQWVHVALTWDGTTYRVYIDGTELATGPYSGLAQLGSFVDVGNSGSAASRNSGFNGVIDEVRLYSRPLAASEIVAMISLPRPKAPTDLHVVE